MVKRNLLHKIGWPFITSFMVLGLLSCDNSKKNTVQLTSYVNQLKEKLTHLKKKDQVFTVMLPTPIQYTAATLRQPFDEKEIAPSKGESQTNPLMNYPINMLKFVGTIYKNDVIYAYILAPDSKLYQLQAGDLIGNREGKITKIYSNRLEIMEQDAVKGVIGQHLVTLELKDENK